MASPFVGVAVPAAGIGKRMGGVRKPFLELAGRPVLLWSLAPFLEHPDVAASLNNLATLYAKQGRYDEAEPLRVETLKARKRTLGVDNRATIQSMNNLANQYWRQRRYDEAEPLYRESLEARRRVYGEKHLATFRGHTTLGSLLRERGQLEEAEPCAAVGLGNRHGEQPGLAERAPERRVEALTAFLLQGTLALVGRLLAEEPGREVDDRLLVVAVLEVHGYILGTRGRPRPISPIRSRWISFVPPPKVRIRSAR